jgi:NADPH2:quinone reductase
MRAIVVRQFGGPEVLKLDSVEDRAPGPAEVKVRIRAVGINPYETYMRTGNYAIKPPLPFVPGSDAAGEVEAVGAQVKTLKPGDRVYTYAGKEALIGTYAEAVVCPANRVFPLGNRVSFAQGAAIGVPYTTAYRALFQKGHGLPGETVLIHGATGGVGLAAVQLAHHRGLRVIGSAGSGRSLDVVREQGADMVVSHLANGYREEIMAATDHRGVDLILEMAAHLNLDHDLGLLAPGGRIVVIGSRGPLTVDPRKAMNCDGHILGMIVLNASEQDVASAHAALSVGLTNGTINPIVREELPLVEAGMAHERVMNSPDDAVGKIVLIP